MCGILGTISFPIADPAAFDIDAGLAAIRHRGPDDRGIWRDEHAALAMVRLSIVDLAGGHQPMILDNGRAVIVFNGELYNHRQLRQRLQAEGRQFVTSSDTEVVLHAVDAWGRDALARFNGMFTFAVWWPAERRALIARDGLGEKPLYLRKTSTHVSFSSELKGLLAAEAMPREVDPRGLANYLRFGHAVAPTTLLRGVDKLLPGHCIEIDGEQARTTQWFNLANVDDVPAVPKTHQGCVEVVRSLLDDAVALRMVADVPVGAFLSGGVDSSAIVALMQRRGGGVVKTFSIGFADDGYDETAAARRLAREFGTEHHELRVDAPDLPAALQTLVHHYDEPFADSAGFPLLLLSRFAAEHVKVVLTGDGGDEVFGGYRRYVAEQAAPAWSSLPRFFTHGVARLAGHAGRARRVRRLLDVMRERDGAARMAGWLEVFDLELLNDVVREAWAVPDHDAAATLSASWRALQAPFHVDSINRVLFAELNVWLSDTYTEKVDKATMAASLEARLPFLDPRLVSFALRLPGSTKVRGRQTKAILKEALRGLVPDDVLARKKRGFSVPTDPWFRGPLKGFTHDVLFGTSARLRDYLDIDVVARLWADHTSGRAVRDEQLWTLLNFELWAQQVL